MEDYHDNDDDDEDVNDDDNEDEDDAKDPVVLPHEQVQSGGIRQLQGIVPLCTRDFTLDPSYNYNLDDDFMILL